MAEKKPKIPKEKKKPTEHKIPIERSKVPKPKIPGGRPSKGEKNK